MWPFRNLKLELDQAERANATLRNKLRDTNADWRKDYEGLTLKLRRMTTKAEDHLVQATNAQRERDAAIRHAGELVAERDAALRKAENVDANWAACQNKLAEARIALQGAMVRDSNGRLRKWAEPEPVLMGVARTNTYFDNRCGEMDG